jgi:hypothetical protein
MNTITLETSLRKERVARSGDLVIVNWSSIGLDFLVIAKFEKLHRRTVGQAGIILDQWIAAGKAKSMIAVMPIDNA